MRYAQIRKIDISNGEGIGVSLFVQGCNFHCKGCFNTETWDFDGGKEWNNDIKKGFLEFIDKPYITRVSLLGGECLASQNLDGILDLVKEIRLSFGDTKTIYLYTGYTWESIMRDLFINHYLNKEDMNENAKRQEIISLCDVLVDGRYEEDKRDISLPFRGSSNQRVIDVQKSLKQNKVILHCE